MAFNLPLDIGSTTSGQSAQMTNPVVNSTGGQKIGPPSPPGSQNTGYGVASAPTGGGTGGSGAASVVSGNNQPASNFNPDQYAQDQAAKAQSELDARNNQIRSGISSSYQPIFNEFDRQIGLLPQQQSDAEQNVNTLATGQQNDVTSSRDRQVSDLNSNISDENNQANMNLNDLGQNIKNMLKAASFYLGSLGAGDSSAAGDYTTAITNNADRTRGQILNTRDVAVHQINQKIADVNSLAGQNLNDIDTWKNTQLNTIAQEFRQQLANLNMGKAQAQGQEGKDMQALQQSALDNFYGRLKQLDDTVYGYKAAIAQWQTERQGWLNDQLTLMHNSGAYTSGTNPIEQQLMQAFMQAGYGNPAQTMTPANQAPGSGANTKTPNTGSSPFTLQDIVNNAQNSLNTGVGNLFQNGQ